MARNFNGTESINFPVPAAMQIDGGPITIIAVVKLNASAYHAAIYTRSTGAHAWWLEFDTAGGLHTNYGTGTTARNIGTISTGAYAMVVARKDNGGSVHPFGRTFTGAGFTTDGGDVDSGLTLIDGTAADATYSVQVGRWGNTGTDYSHDMDVAFLAVFNTYVANGTITTLKTEADILAATPQYWISFEGSTTVDSVGGTATINGSPDVVSDPTGFFASAGSVSGTAAAALGALAGTAAGLPTVLGTAAKNLGALAGTAAGTVTHPGTAAKNLGALTGTAAGTRTVLGTAAALLGGLAGSAGAGATKVGTAVAPLGSVIATAAGGRTTFGTASATLGTLACSATQAGTVTGTASAALGGLTAATSGTDQEGEDVTSQGSWYQLLDILRLNDEELRELRTRIPEACPHCGTPLQTGPNGELHCVFDGWIWDGVGYPRPTSAA